MNEQKKPSFARSAESILIEDRLAELAVGDVISYAELNSLAPDLDVQGVDRSKLETARRHLLDRVTPDGEPGYAFGVIVGEGLRRLDNDGIYEQSQSDARRIQRASKRSFRKLQQVDYEGLSEDGRQKHVMQSAALGAAALCVTPSKQVHLKGAARAALQSKSGRLDVSETLALFSKT